MLQSADVCVSKISNVHVVSRGHTIFSWIIDAVYFYRADLGLCRFDETRHEVGFRIVDFTELTIRICSSGVKISQRGPAQAIGAPVPIESTLDEELGLTVRIHRKLR